MPDASTVWLRRLYASPDGRDLVAMESRRRLFGGLLRRMLILRDDVCTTPWCEAPIAHADHTTPSRAGGVTSFHSGTGKCERCNYGKEALGWVTTALPVAEGCSDTTRARHRVHVTTPVGRTYASDPPPLLGWGSTVRRSGTAASTERSGSRAPIGAAGVEHHGREPGARRRPRLSRRRHRVDRDRARLLASWRLEVTRFRYTSHLERELCRYLT